MSRFSFTQQLLLAFALSIALGLLLPSVSPYASVLGSWYLNAIKFMVVPIILISIPTTLSDIADLKGSLVRIISLFFAHCILCKSYWTDGGSFHALGGITSLTPHTVHKHPRDTTFFGDACQLHSQ